MKTEYAEKLALSDDLMEHLQFMQQNENLARMIRDTINLNGFIVVKLDLDNSEKEHRQYIEWLHFLYDIMEFLQLLESSAKERRTAV